MRHQICTHTGEVDPGILNGLACNRNRHILVLDDGICPCRFIQQHPVNAIDIIIARPDTTKVNPYYLCAFTNMPHGKRQIDEGTGGAAQQHFNVGKYNKLKLMLPPLEEQNRFVDFVKQVDKSKVAIQKSLDETRLLFDSLMQEYFC